MIAVALVALGASLGAAVRFWTAQRLDGSWPVGTLSVNVVGSFALGLMVGLEVSDDALLLLGTGFAGGLTTYSAFAVQTEALARRSPTRAAAYAVGTVGVPFAACALGYALAAGLA